MLTVAICTRNRAASLRRALASLANCAPPPGSGWEVLVVDNGSNDETSSVAASFDGVLPLRLVHENNPGLSHARNAAVSAGRGEYMLWTDDDCVVDRAWLTSYAVAFRQWPECALFGGPIVPRFDGHPPAWLTRVASRVGTAYAARDFGPQPVPLGLADNRVPFGANFAIRAAEQRSRFYDTRLGRGTALPMGIGEETEVLENLLGGGASGRWVPQAAVTHCIPPERQQLAYLRDYYQAVGASAEWRAHEARVGANIDNPSRFSLLRLALRSEVRYLILSLAGRPEQWIGDFIAASVTDGRLRARRAIEAHHRGHSKEP